MLSNLSNLKTIKIKNLDFHESFDFLSMGLLSFLTKINFDQVFMQEDDFRFLMESIGKKLAQFTISYYRYEHDASFYLQEIFNKCTNLKSLDVDFAIIKDLKLVNIPSLKDFILNVKRITFDKSSERLENVENLKFHVKFALDKEFAHLLHFCPLLRNLNLTCTYNESYLTSKAFKNLKYLKKLNLVIYYDKDFLNAVDIVTKSQTCIDFTIIRNFRH
ncbi:hypothetical protein B4U79_18620 [Dinothrombium tinctorium]|uniref:Uncharacterized protein n=1 Tax=Dinothrombium tinctorium TaxID=1965070 RepID=A0A3S4QAD8_9ACAR|nr:hypothetical protein B4U79_18620 [Dinothrombium tinctorium]